VIALIFIAAVAASQPETYAQIQAKSVAEVRQADSEMDRQFQLAIERLRSCRANTVQCYYWNKAIPRLQREQAAWKQWRDAKAYLGSVEMEGTSGEVEVRNAIKVEMTKARSAELSKIGRQ
jgi:uncharacterized protein YecT (DUF1311 family)